MTTLPPRARSRVLPQWLSFAMAGGVGFVVDSSVLALLFHVWHVDPKIARFFSFLAAVTATWLLNRRFTFIFRDPRPLGHAYFTYIAIQSAGAILNFSIYVWLLGASVLLARYPVIALALGAIPAMVFNFMLTRRLLTIATP